METLARWVPTTPEMEIKVLFGRHVWDCARHADALGRRAFELRAPLHFSLPARAPYRDFLREVTEVSDTGERLHAFYAVVIPGLCDQYSSYIAQTDLLMDEPTVRILEGAVRDFERMDGERDRLAQGVLGGEAKREFPQWQQRRGSIVQVVEHGEGARARGVAE